MELFLELISGLGVEHEAYYLWTDPPDKMIEFFSTARFKKPLIILGIKDLLDFWMEYDFWHDRVHAGVDLLRRYCGELKDHHVVILTSLENLQKELSLPNVSVVSWGGDITNQYREYQELQPVSEKNFDSTRTFVCLTRHVRPYRQVLLSYLLGKDLDQFGYISCLEQDKLTYDLLDRLPWQFESRHDHARDLILDGYKKLQHRSDLMIDPVDIYDGNDNDNVGNFSRSLVKKYRDSFVEVVAESSFTTPSFNITEKTLNSIYGCNFPIILCSSGTVAHLRELGFDMFDDVIDHSYDQIDNPLDRLLSAIDSNIEILTNGDLAKERWLRCRGRFASNVDVARTIYGFYADRARKEFSQALLTIKWPDKS